MEFEKGIKLLGKKKIRKALDKFFIPDLCEIIIDYLNEIMNLYRGKLIMARFNLFDEIELPGNSSIDEHPQLSYETTDKVGDNTIFLDWIDNFTHVEMKETKESPMIIKAWLLQNEIKNTIHYIKREYKYETFTQIRKTFDILHVMPISEVSIRRYNGNVMKINEPFYINFRELWNVEIMGSFIGKGYYLLPDIACLLGSGEYKYLKHPTLTYL